MSALPAGGRVQVPALRRLSQAQARKLTAEVRGDLSAVWVRVLELYEGQAHVALGYGSWREYWEAEFGQSGTRGEQYVRAGRVARALTEAGLTPPANDTVARELLPVLRQDPDQLPAVWTRALDLGAGNPTGREVRELVSSSYEAYRRPGADKTARARRLRSAVEGGLRRARAGAESAEEGLEEALATDPPQRALDAWRTDAEEALRALEEVLSMLAEES